VSSSAVDQFDSTVKTYEAKIATHVQQTRDETYRIANDAYKTMNQSFDSYSSDLATKNSSIYDKINSLSSSNTGIEELESNVASVASQVNDPSRTQTVADSMNTYSSEFTSNLDKTLTASVGVLQEARSEGESQDHETSQLAQTGVTGFSSSVSAYSGVLDELVGSIYDSSGSTKSSTKNLLSGLNSIGQGAQEMVQLTSSDLASVIAKYTADSEASRTAIEEQLKAAGIAEASAADALNIWNSLKDTATQYTTDALGNLSSTASKVFEQADKLVENTTLETSNQLSDLTSVIGKIQSDLATDNDSNISIMDNVLNQLQQMEQSAVSAKSDYTNQIAGLRGYVNQLATQLTAREQAIVGQAAQFKTAIETSAAQDITAVSR
jgi:hypothetical protein